MSLKSSIKHLQTTLEYLKASALHEGPHPSQSGSGQVNALSLIRDATELLKAHTTKLSLLCMNEPYSPKELSHILVTELSSRVFPALINALILCNPNTYGILIHNHVKAELCNLCIETYSIIDLIPLESKQINEEDRKQAILAATAKIWSHSDVLISWTDLGYTQLVEQKVRMYEALLKDAIDELTAWDPEDEDSEDDIFGLDDDSSGQDDAASEKAESKTAVDTKDVPKRIRDNEAVEVIRQGQKTVLDRLKLTKLLFPALIKRRVKTCPNICATTAVADFSTKAHLDAGVRLLEFTAQFSAGADEVIESLYARDMDDVAASLQRLCEAGEACSVAARKDWNSNEDEFTKWLDGWLDRSKKLQLHNICA